MSNRVEEIVDAEPTLGEALAHIAVWETDRVVRSVQAQEPPGQPYETCFRALFVQAMDAWKKKEERLLKKVRVDFFKETGKWYTTEELSVPGSADSQPSFFVPWLVERLRGEDGRPRYQGMEAVCLDWFGVPVKARVPSSCRIEAQVVGELDAGKQPTGTITFEVSATALEMLKIFRSYDHWKRLVLTVEEAVKQP